MLNTAYLALGTNLGVREHYLYTALKELNDTRCIKITDFSSIYETDPVGYTDQDSFLNMVIKVKTDLSPLDLLRILQEIEIKLGRERKIRWGPRTIDLDILLYNQENIDDKQLTIPHPRMHERAFVVIPLMDIDKDLILPNSKRALSQYIDKLPDIEGVHLWKQKNGEDVFELFEN